MNKILTCFFLILSAVSARAQDFEPVLGPRPLSFPRDHGSHPEQAIEWWYFTGHLRAESRKTYGFELTFFRVGLSRKPLSPSAWESNSIFLADFAITDGSKQQFLSSDKRARESFEAAGASQENLDVHIGNWRAELKSDGIELSAEDAKKSLSLLLKPAKPVVLQGDAGFSVKGDKPGEASLYTSITRLNGQGSFRLNDVTEKVVEASAWMDHEAFTSQESTGDHSESAKGWDWFALQLDSGEEVMLYQLRDEKGAATRFSAGTFVAKDGTAVRLSQKDFDIRVLRMWQSATTSKRYPAEWQIDLPRLSRSFHVVPTVPNQELMSAAGIPYWEGRSIIEGPALENRGAAYVELVGY